MKVRYNYTNTVYNTVMDLYCFTHIQGIIGDILPIKTLDINKVLFLLHF